MIVRDFLSYSSENTKRSEELGLTIRHCSQPSRCVSPHGTKSGNFQNGLLAHNREVPFVSKHDCGLELVFVYLLHALIIATAKTRDRNSQISHRLHGELFTCRISPFEKL